MLTLKFGKVTKFCWICGKDSFLEHCKTDEYGLRVHESCDARRKMLKLASEQAEAWRTSQSAKVA